MNRREFTIGFAAIAATSMASFGFGTDGLAFNHDGTMFRYDGIIYGLAVPWDMSSMYTSGRR